MTLNDANAAAGQLDLQQVGEKLSATSRSDPSGVVDFAGLAVDAAPVVADVAFGVFEVIGEILAGILS